MWKSSLIKVLFYQFQVVEANVLHAILWSMMNQKANEVEAGCSWVEFQN